MKESDYPKIVILYGGISNERAVSLMSGKRVYHELKLNFDVELVDIDKPEIARTHFTDNSIAFPLMHGEFGEDGKAQKILEAMGIHYVGSDVESSAICMNKILTKQKVAVHGVRLTPSIAFTLDNKPDAKTVTGQLGNDVVLKPVCGGSTLDVSLLSGEKEISDALEILAPGYWMIEKRIFGPEVSIGVLNGKSMGVVGINPEGGFHDYARKYTPGLTKHELPANLSADVLKEIQHMTEVAFAACGCRDFGRVDMMVEDGKTPYFLELNTIPGMTPTSIYPDSGKCMGYDSDELCRQIVMPAMQRFKSKLLTV
ncbi:MAG: D-alanine--D-alanine ligase [Verrucomicrobia bacterium CG_4_10_14_3_um_filter_43_23]|nr:MAG: hypothetical protein AUJ82_05940 [Verrucomicrobia bacterium CG1_02_43_26]PIP60040.1 MAG: D-alanine--D-alanine ligase [Verrucomicrobia bacterium CG22_combo_CG10-13_8_21_14_all_43_17]PIX58984.1 MAG: D-alanine--D-alanine ligase [Verrucomicrobia bacterium CG_4_10_14_3_um_filter_43_23]PIY63008.1 MAG: D-alanine--D-alanine ligase [Verrucomicrobia bacterium CG_4_10_14_0_8_um_filter_43_34]PJA44934.1 MAG: D-alanine--D-alanine ligase [Verrucomicrobia bacterium CG_4_9_14_3_um_filter_43_20]